MILVPALMTGWPGIPSGVQRRSGASCRAGIKRLGQPACRVSFSDIRARTTPRRCAPLPRRRRGGITPQSSRAGRPPSRPLRCGNRLCGSCVHPIATFSTTTWPVINCNGPQVGIIVITAPALEVLYRRRRAGGVRGSNAGNSPFYVVGACAIPRSICADLAELDSEDVRRH